MTSKFTVSITLGNAAMQEPHHVAWALREVCMKLEQGQEVGAIHDLLGNSVGRFEGNFDEEERDSI